MKVHLGTIRLLVSSVLASGRCANHEVKDQEERKKLDLTSAALDFVPGEKNALYVLGESSRCPSLSDSALSFPFPVMSPCPRPSQVRY